MIDIRIECDECGEDIADGDNVYCNKCYEKNGGLNQTDILAKIDAVQDKLNELRNMVNG